MFAADRISRAMFKTGRGPLDICEYNNLYENLFTTSFYIYPIYPTKLYRGVPTLWFPSLLPLPLYTFPQQSKALCISWPGLRARYNINRSS